MPLSPAGASVERFRRSFEQLVGAEKDALLGLAVSGGPDSMAMLLLAAAALPGRVRAATVDHGFRAGSADEARQVGAVCNVLGVPHEILPLEWDTPSSNRQALARTARYRRLAEWARKGQLRFVATAHHLDDQAETLLMRLDRGAGVGGLTGIRARRPLLHCGGGDGAGEVALIRPLLGWRRTELRQIVAESGIAAVDDPANHDPAHDRTRARAVLDRSPDWPNRLRMAASAAYLGEADRALEWAARELATARERMAGGAYLLDVTDVPPELQRRMVRNLINRVAPDQEEPRGDVLARALERLGGGEVASLAGVVIRPVGMLWRVEAAPSRRRNASITV